MVQVLPQLLFLWADRPEPGKAAEEYGCLLSSSGAA